MLTSILSHQDSLDIYNNGTIVIHKQDNHYRRKIKYNNKLIPYSKIIWNKEFPNDLVQIDEVIHHLNGDTLDDQIDNYIKVTHSEHLKYHSWIHLKKLRNNKKLYKEHPDYKTVIDLYKEFPLTKNMSYV